MAWGTSACAFFLFAWPKLAQLHDFLSREEAYAVPFPPTSRAEGELLARRVSDILELPFGFYGRPWGTLIGAAAALLALAGALSLARRDRLGAAVLGAPLIGAATALASGLYPYAPRFVLFLVRLVVVLVAAGAAAALRALLKRGLARRLVGAAGVTAAFFLLSVAGASTARLLGGQWEMEEIRPVLEHIRSAWRASRRPRLGRGAANREDRLAERRRL